MFEGCLAATHTHHTPHLPEEHSCCCARGATNTARHAAPAHPGPKEAHHSRMVPSARASTTNRNCPVVRLAPYSGHPPSRWVPLLLKPISACQAV